AAGNLASIVVAPVIDDDDLERRSVLPRERGQGASQERRLVTRWNDERCHHVATGPGCRDSVLTVTEKTGESMRRARMLSLLLWASVGCGGSEHGGHLPDAPPAGEPVADLTSAG